MGISSPSSFFWVRMVAYEVSEVKVYKIKYLLKLRLLNARVCVIASLILLKDSFISWFHLNTTFLWIIPYKDLIISANLETNLSTKFILCKKYWMAFLLFGYVIVVMDSIPLGSIKITSL